MRILSYGHVKPKQVSCNCCGATLEYVPRDIETFRPGTRHAKNFVRCPVCRSVIWVNDMLVKNDKYMTFAEE